MKLEILFLFLFIFLFIGCPEPNSNQKYENHAFVVNKEKVGSGFRIKKNLFITAKHIIIDSSDNFYDVYIIIKDLVLSGKVVAYEDDIALIETKNDIVNQFFSCHFYTIDTNQVYDFLGWRVWWLQPVYDTVINKFMVLYNTGFISGFNRKSILINKEGFPMVSGSAVLDEKGSILAIATKTYNVYGKYDYLIADFIPPSIVQYINNYTPD